MHHMSKPDIELLKRLLETKKSLQLCTLMVNSAENRTPIVDAILFGNINFLKTVMKSKAVLNIPLERLIPLDSE